MLAVQHGIYNGVIRRTALADEYLIGITNAVEDIPVVNGYDPVDPRPFERLSIGDGELDDVAMKLEDVMAMDSERLGILDLYRAARRIVRQIVRIVGATPSVRVRHAYPREWALSLYIPSGNPIGTRAIDRAAHALQRSLRDDPRFRAPMERFWRISDLVLRELEATVNADIDINFPAAAQGKPVASVRKCETVRSPNESEMPF